LPRRVRVRLSVSVRINRWDRVRFMVRVWKYMSVKSPELFVPVRVRVSLVPGGECRSASAALLMSAYEHTPRHFV